MPTHLGRFHTRRGASRAGTTVQTVLRIYGSKEALSVLAMEASDERLRPVTPPGDIAAAVRVLYETTRTSAIR